MRYEKRKRKRYLNVDAYIVTILSRASICLSGDLCDVSEGHTYLGYIMRFFLTVVALISNDTILVSLGSFNKTRLQRRGERHQTKGLMSKTIAVHVRSEPLRISLPFSAQQQREMTKVCIFWRTQTAMANLLYLNAVGAYLA